MGVVGAFVGVACFGGKLACCVKTYSLVQLDSTSKNYVGQHQKTAMIVQVRRAKTVQDKELKSML